MTDGLTAAEVWEERYRSRPAVWSGKPNAVLVAEASTLAGGTALDVGCGEGADAIWLAEQGWTVTAVDVSPTALARGAAESERRGVADRITWHEADLMGWEPSDRYDLVAAAFLHSQRGLSRERVLRAAAEAVASGGALLILAHAERPPWASGAAHFEALPTARQGWDELGLAPDEWTLRVCEERTREGRGPDGATHTLIDAVVVAIRTAT
jgi:SAM-dependent methyltransferase